MSGTSSLVGILAGADGAQDVALGDHARARGLRVDHHGGADLALAIADAASRSVCPGPP